MSIPAPELRSSVNDRRLDPGIEGDRLQTGDRVAAFVVTYRRSVLLRANLAALAAQTRTPDAVIVINNDPDDDVRSSLWQEFPDVGLVDLAENVGSAGGFARALYIASRCNFTWAWLLDDDVIPESGALEGLLAASARLQREGRPTAMLAPVQLSSRGPFGGARWRNRIVPIPPALREEDRPVEVDLAYWAGLLVHRTVVSQIGYPRTEFFRCFADYEYCLRARRAGVSIVVVPTSRVAHHDGLHRTVVGLGRTSVRSGYNPARHYYDARNAAYTAWYTMGSPLAVAFQLARQCRLAAGDLLYEDQKLRRLTLRIRGTVEGLRGRLGRREEIE